MEKWKLHDNYELSTNLYRSVTRSQTGIHKLDLNMSTLNSLVNPVESSNLSEEFNLIEILKGRYGSLHRTIITRSSGKFYDVSISLEEKMNEYKDLLNQIKKLNQW